MNIKKSGDNYKVESGSTKGKWYEVDPDKPWCNCPAYKFKYMRANKLCKHITSVKEYIEKTQQKTLNTDDCDTDDVLSFIEENDGEVDSMELIDKFGDKAVDRLLKQGELIEKHGKIKILK